MKQIVILGSTGSIGTQTLDIIRHQTDMEVYGLSCGENIDLMETQIRTFHPKVVCVYDKEAAKRLASRVEDFPVSILSGMDGLLSLASDGAYDTLLSAIVGMIGILPTIEAIKARKTICLANKETLVCAGHIIMPLAKQYGVDILPVDSEHSAIFQSLQGHQENAIKNILLTASGGPFFGKTKEELADVTVAEALSHPNWTMGKKITIDSATMVNKGLEVIEAKWLFDVTPDQIKVLIHPQSILHSAVTFSDGAVIGQMGLPDMHLPIQYALTYPYRREIANNTLDLVALSKMTFFEPDKTTFKGLSLAYTAIRAGGNLPTVYNAANERAVSMFLNGRIGFLQITELIEKMMDCIRFVDDPDVDEILDTERRVNSIITEYI